MTLKEKIIALKEKVRRQHQLWESKMLSKDKKEILNNSYYIAHYNEVLYTIEDLDEDDDMVFCEELIDEMLNHDGDIMQEVYDFWKDYRNGEEYNFFEYSTIVDVIRDTFGIY